MHVGLSFYAYVHACAAALCLRLKRRVSACVAGLCTHLRPRSRPRTTRTSDQSRQNTSDSNSCMYRRKSHRLQESFLDERNGHIENLLLLQDRRHWEIHMLKTSLLTELKNTRNFLHRGRHEDIPQFVPLRLVHTVRADQKVKSEYALPSVH